MVGEAADGCVCVCVHGLRLETVRELAKSSDSNLCMSNIQ